MATMMPAWVTASVLIPKTTFIGDSSNDREKGGMGSKKSVGVNAFVRGSNQG